ncbi:MAG: ATP-binding cassette domain-containing protein [Cyclobacteriaceae bacterium]|nr:ATP-binding cassette domain-containing protein [Cyclobacteriaceae bacterium]
MNQLVVENVTKRYANHVALNNVSLAVPSQSIYGLLGPNGAGKTTLIRIINQIIDADEGTILINGEKLLPHHIAAIGYLPEERGLYKKLKVGEQLIYFARLRGLSRSDALIKIKYWIEKFEIKDWWNKKIEDLSKGMAQKVQFISTVLHEPKLIILDEPFSGFDPVNTNLIRDEILELREKGSTIIFSTHRMETVEELCDHIALINKSKKILEGAKKDVKAKYRTNTYIVEHRGNFSLEGEKYEHRGNRSLDDGYQETLIRIKSDRNANQLIHDLVDATEIHGFKEQIPSMNEIFIQLVNGGSDE